MERIPDRTKAAPVPQVQLGMARPETVADGRLRAGNASKGGLVSRQVQVLRSRGARARQAFLRRIEPGESLLLAPCGAVHSLGARTALRVLFLDPRDRVLQVCALRPWRTARPPQGAAAALIQRDDEPETIAAGQRIDWLVGQPRLPERADWLQTPEDPA